MLKAKGDGTPWHAGVKNWQFRGLKLAAINIAMVTLLLILTMVNMVNNIIVTIIYVIII